MTDSNRKVEDLAQKQAFWATLGAMFAVGCAVIQFEWIFTHHLGAALMIAALLGATVDLFLRQRLMRDAVEAAFGSMLPPQLREELRSIYEHRLLVSQRLDVRLEHYPEKNLVIYHAKVIRVIKNHSEGKRPVIFSGGTAEYFSPHGRSELTSCGYSIDGKRHNFEPRREPFSVGYGSRETEVELQPDQSMEWYFSYKLFVTETGVELLTHPYPVVEAIVTVDTPPSLIANVTFAQRNKFAENSPEESGIFIRTLNGVLLPHQDIRVYWYPKKDVEALRRELASEQQQK